MFWYRLPIDQQNLQYNQTSVPPHKRWLHGPYAENIYLLGSLAMEAFFMLFSLIMGSDITNIDMPNDWSAAADLVPSCLGLGI